MSFLYLSYSVHVCMQGCSLAGPGDPWCLSFALRRQENLSFFIQSYAGHPRFYSFRVNTAVSSCSLLLGMFRQEEHL